MQTGPWVENGGMSPPYGQDNSEHLQVFAIKLIGRRANRYEVLYSANMRAYRPPPAPPSNNDYGHFENSNGEWCGDEIQQSGWLHWINAYSITVRPKRKTHKKKAASKKLLPKRKK